MRASWHAWYRASLEAGRPLETRAEVVHFARKAQQRLHEGQRHDVELIEWEHGRQAWVDDALAALDALLAVGERDRRQIARLTEALELLLDCKGGGKGTVSGRGGYPAVCEKCADAARAVLADEEDADNG